MLDTNHVHQLSAMVQYYLSKRTSLYAQAVYQRTNQGAQGQINSVFVPSSSSSQFLGAVGITTFFYGNESSRAHPFEYRLRCDGEAPPPLCTNG